MNKRVIEKRSGEEEEEEEEEAAIKNVDEFPIKVYFQIQWRRMPPERILMNT